jgi:hypothetical protein
MSSPTSSSNNSHNSTRTFEVISAVGADGSNLLDLCQKHKVTRTQPSVAVKKIITAAYRASDKMITAGRVIIRQTGQTGDVQTATYDALVKKLKKSKGESASDSRKSSHPEFQVIVQRA